MEVRKEAREFISVITRSESAKVYINDIVYIESEGRKIHIHTEDSRYSMYRKLDEVAEKLPENFYRCHKSCIINFEKVANMRNRLINFECGISLVMGQDKYVKAVQSYRGYLIANEKRSRDAVKK